jgi:hypothetical protein
MAECMRMYINTGNVGGLISSYIVEYQPVFVNVRPYIPIQDLHGDYILIQGLSVNTLLRPILYSRSRGALFKMMSYLHIQYNKNAKSDTLAYHVLVLID